MLTVQNSIILYKGESGNSSFFENKKITVDEKYSTTPVDKNVLPEILFITSYPPRECGIATYTQDLMNAIKEKFGVSFSLKVCALEEQEYDYEYPKEVKYILNSSKKEQYEALAEKINSDGNLVMIILQHEFGLFGGDYGDFIISFLSRVNKPVITALHTLLPDPDGRRKKVIQDIVSLSESMIVMTNNSARILKEHYDVDIRKVTVIPHGTHLVSSFHNKKKRIGSYLGSRLVLSTFGLLSSGKSIETAIEALPAIIEVFPDVIYLVIGKTHPGVVKNDGEKYRDFLHEKVIQLGLQSNVWFINQYLSLGDLLDYLQRTDIYLFTSKDPNQAVSGTLAYAMSCGCPVVSTPIPHAKEFLDGAGVNFDFQNSQQLSDAVIKLLSDPGLMHEMKLNALHKISPTAWQNSAISHIRLLQKNIKEKKIQLTYQIPEISLNHIKHMTTNTGMIQFAAISIPDLNSGYTLDDNSRALIALARHFEITDEREDIVLIETYLNFILFCQQADGNFLNYVDINGKFFEKNNDENLEDSNGRAIWALGEFISMGYLFDQQLVKKAESAFKKTIKQIATLHSPRAISFVIKGLYHYNLVKNEPALKDMIIDLADDLVSKYRGVSDEKWKWYEDYLTYANSVIPEALLYAYMATGSELFKSIAKSSFDFLLSLIFSNGNIKVISNQGWHLKGEVSNKFGEQPIDIAYTILALSHFYDIFKEESYLEKMEISFNWFLGKNHLHRIIYNPCTGGCYDGLEENHINLNQGAESTLSYLLSRLTVEKYYKNQHDYKTYSNKSLNQYQFMVSSTLMIDTSLTKAAM